mgnify:CR=1 FL=1
MVGGFVQIEVQIHNKNPHLINNAELTLTLKLAFKQVNPAAEALGGAYHDYGDSRATARKIVRGSPADWIAWKMSFIRSDEQFWKGKFWLVK